MPDASIDDGQTTASMTGSYTYTYADTATEASTKITAHSYSGTAGLNTVSIEDHYEYDAKGNITGIYRLPNNVKTYTHKYYYDEANQLVREDYAGGDQTIVYTYDKGGNLVSKDYYPLTFDELPANAVPTYTANYNYRSTGWKDVLTGYDGSSISTDAAGNITCWGGMDLYWNAGRQLELTVTDDKIISYAYNENGFISKETCYMPDPSTNLFICFYTYEFFWEGDRMIGCRMVLMPDDQNERTEQVFHYIYDTDGELLGAYSSDGECYQFIKNLQGDVIGYTALTEDYTYVGNSYEAYGTIHFELTATGALARLQEYGRQMLLRIGYRGYLQVFTGNEICYYLGSRFYSPTLGRFLNADVYQDTMQGVVGTNMFAYCNNNPVMNIDPFGKSAIAGSVGQVALYSVLLIGFTSAILAIAGVHVSFEELIPLATSLVGQHYGVSSVYLVAALISYFATRTSAKVKHQDQVLRSTIGRYKSRNEDAYWEAEFAYGGKCVKLSEDTLTFKQAKNCVQLHGNVFASSQTAAYRLFVETRLPGYKPIPEIHHGDGVYYYHYHPFPSVYEENSVHIWYL